MSDVTGINLPVFFEYYTFPVKMVRTASGGLAAWRLSGRTGGWEAVNHLADKILFARGGEVDVISREEFVQLVERNRAEVLKGEGSVYALYETMKSIMDVADAEDRALTAAERALIEGLARKTFVMFEEKLRQDGDPAADASLAE
ncbi:hypothetical protein SAMN05444365_103229 [Micromonospora pattaloongensis]|uniref:Uncharacterized protein n=1 Tax=Micromonospora pattaloongensis TaxID=405436 RepID=A0A1H3M5L9_9ACTN|nr:hypothetical protein [Micromonospora pattaloongensis]SDY71594.1 hypothetical protein SAMN05444365_103229 [Micromonospora pattaloongensis]